MSEQTIVLMVGIPASGKSTFIKNMITKDNVPSAWVSRDEIRKSLVGNHTMMVEEYFSKEDEVFNQFIDTINSEIEKGTERIFIDATHISERSRAKTLNRIKNTEKLNLNVVWLKCGVQVALARNHDREGFARVPDDAIRNMARQFQDPMYIEFWKYNFKKVTIYTN